jgi:hypothetical protein
MLEWLNPAYINVVPYPIQSTFVAQCSHPIENLWRSHPLCVSLISSNRFIVVKLFVELKHNFSNGVPKVSPWENPTNRARDLNIEKFKNLLVLSQYRNYGILNKNTCPEKSLNSLPTRLSDEPVFLTLDICDCNSSHRLWRWLLTLLFRLIMRISPFFILLDD